MSEYHDFDFEVPAELKERYDIKRIAKEADTILIELDHKAIRFDIESKWKNTVANFEKQSKIFGITNEELKQALMLYLSEQYLKLLENGNGKEEERSGSDIIIPFEEWQTKLAEKYEALHTTVKNNLPSLWNAFEFALSVKTILNIKGVTLPFAGIILGPPSSLKTVVIELLRGHRNTFHTHNFSPKAFVSHNTAIKKEDLPNIDLLPKIKNRLFLTPELAPIFAARDDDLLQVLSILTSILDGHGYESDTGGQGHRGYNEDIMFAWLGAVVDIPFRVHKQLSQLGAKLYFYRLPKLQHEEDHYFNKKSDDFTKKAQAISQSLSEYLEYFDSVINNEDNNKTNKNKLPKIQLDETKDEDLAHRYIIRLGMLLAPLRAIVPTWETRDTQGSDYAYGIAMVEEPDRAITQLRNLARGHALSKGRNYITVEDIPMLINVVLSTCSIERQTIFEILLDHDGVMTTSQIVESFNITSPTARRTMTELKATGLVTMSDVDAGIYNSEKQITLNPRFNWFLSDDFKTLKEKYPPRREKNNNKNDGARGGENSFNQNITTFSQGQDQDQDQNTAKPKEEGDYWTKGKWTEDLPKEVKNEK